jgi:hypothetical protein
MIAAIIIAAVAAAVGIASSSAAQGIKNREIRKDHLWTLLYEPVYIQGLSFDAVKTGYLSYYRANPHLFQRYYDEYFTMRTSDLEYDNHPNSDKRKDLLMRRYIVIGLLVCLIIVIYEVNSK